MYIGVSGTANSRHITPRLNEPWECTFRPVGAGAVILSLITALRCTVMMQDVPTYQTAPSRSPAGAGAAAHEHAPPDDHTCMTHTHTHTPSSAHVHSLHVHAAAYSCANHICTDTCQSHTAATRMYTFFCLSLAHPDATIHGTWCETERANVV